MHVRLKHVKPVTRTLASGERVTYLYHRVTGKRICGQPGTSEFLANYEVACRLDGRVAPDTFAAMVMGFRASPEFSNLRERTRTDYDKHLNSLLDKFGAVELEAFNDHRIRRDIMEWRDVKAKQSLKQADYAMAVLRLTLQWAYNQGRLGINHAMRVGKLYTSKRSGKIWEEDEIDALMIAAHDTVRWVFLLALNTGQRQGDLLTMTWNAYDGTAIKLRQSKGGKLVYVPCTAELRSVLAKIPRRATTILTNQKGLPWTSDGFRTMFDRTKRQAGIRGKTFHDTRGTFVTRSAERGGTVPEIATITGHSQAEVSAIIDCYLARTPELARSLIRKYEKGTKSGKRTGKRLLSVETK